MPIRDWAVSTGSLTAILVTSVLLPVSGAHAQEDAIARCRTAATAEARIACLEDALRADSREDVVETPQTAETGQRRGFRLPGLPFGNREQRDSEGAVAAQADETMPSVDGNQFTLSSEYGQEYPIRPSDLCRESLFFERTSSRSGDHLPQ